MKLSNNRIVKNASWIVVCRIAQAVLSFVIGTISARYLGPSNYGLISYGASVVSFLVPVVQLGLRHVLVQEMVNHPEREGKILGTSLVMSMVSAGLGIVGVAAFTMIANRNDTDTIVVCVLSSISLIFQCWEMIQYWFQTKLKSKYMAVTSLIAYAIASAYRLVLLVTGQSVHWFALATSLDFCIISVVLTVIYKRMSVQKLSFSWDVGKALFSKSRYYIVSGLMVVLHSNTDRVMLTMMRGEGENGFYTAAFTCASLLGFVYEAIIDSVRPIIFESKKHDQKSFESNVKRLYTLVIYMGLLQSLVFTILSPMIISVLYGQEYQASVLVLQVLTWYTAFSYTGTVRNIWILAEDKQRIIWVINLLGAVLNIAGNFVLIPWIGAVGAAIASVATQFFTNFVLSLLLPILRRNGQLMLGSLHPKMLKDIVRLVKR